MQGCDLSVHIDCARSSKAPPRESPAVRLTGGQELQAFRGLHNSVRSGHTLPCRARQYTPCNYSAHNIISNFETDAQPLLDCFGPYPCGCV